MLQCPFVSFATQWSLEDVDRMIGLIAGCLDPVESQTCSGKIPVESGDNDAFVSAFAQLTHLSSCNLTEEELVGKGIDLPHCEEMFGYDFFERANIDQIRLFLFYCARAERFVEGYIEEQVRNEKLKAALRRLEVLRESHPEALLQSFMAVTRLASMPLDSDVIIQRSGHDEHHASLPIGMAACYVFTGQHGCLKVGQVGPNSNPRFKFQHYQVFEGTKSSLARSILDSHEVVDGFEEASADNIGDLIRERTERMNVYLRVQLVAEKWGDKAPIFLLNLLEGFLQCRLKPRFEGKK